MESESSGSTVRVVHVPADLYWIAPTGILLSHWQSFMRHLLGSHVKSMRPAPSGVFELSASAGLDDSSYNFPDDRGGDSASLIAAGMNALTRAHRANSHAGEGSGPSGSPAESQSEPGRDTPRRPRFDPNALSKWEQRAGSTVEAMKQDREKMAIRDDHRISRLEETMDKSLQGMRASIDSRDERMRDEGAFLRRTLEKVLQTIAGHSTDLKHAGVVAEAAAAMGSKTQAPRVEQPSQLAVSSGGPSAAAVEHADYARGDSVTDPVVAELYAALRERRPMTVDGAGFKLGGFKTNLLADMCPEMREVYEARDKVTSQAGFEGLCERTCRNCPTDSPNMPHREGHCPLCWRSGERGNDTLSAASKERGRQKVQDNANRLSRGLPALLAVDVDSLVELVDHGNSA
jgi:hypothetical protein